MSGRWALTNFSEELRVADADSAGRAKMKALLCAVTAAAMLGGGARADAQALNLNGSQASDSIEGTVSKVSPDEIVLSGQKEPIYLDDYSAIRRGGVMEDWSDIKEGASVRVDFQLQDGKRLANEVTVSPANSRPPLPLTPDTNNPIRY